MSSHPFKIYNASAGSGKTHTLTKEYLKIILSSPHSFGQILAITFTNKAVSEMKHRILNSLFQFATLDDGFEEPALFKDLTKELNIDRSTLQKRSAKTLKDILHNYGFFDISTIDKFNHRIIRTFAKDLKLAQNFEVILDTNNLLDEAIDNLLNKVGKDKLLTKVLIDFSLEKIDDDKSWDIAFDLKNFGKLLFDENNITQLQKLSTKEISEFLEFQKSLSVKINNNKASIVKLATDLLELIDSNGLAHNDFSRSSFPKFLLEFKNEFNKVNFTAKWKQDFENASLYNKTSPEDTKLTIDSLRPSFTTSFATIKSIFFNTQLLKNIYNNLVPLTVINAIQKEILAIQKDKNLLTISAFNALISKEIKNQPAPFIYERLGEKFRHYFIDEFQDTSALQWSNLIPLIGNALEGEDLQGNSGSLFLVGDAKQAIYRWRGGKAEQFLELIDKVAEPFVIPPQVFNLPANYRSYEEVIQFNNSFFTTLSTRLTNESYNSLFIQGNKQLTNAKKGGYVQLEFIDQEDRSELKNSYCNTVYKTIESVLQNGHSYKEIAILVRDNKNGAFLADFLSNKNIPVISSDSLLLVNNKKISFLTHLLYFSIDQNNLDSAYNILLYLSDNSTEAATFIHAHLNKLPEFLLHEYDFNLYSINQKSVFDSVELAVKKFDLIKTSDAYITFFLDLIFDIEQKEGTGLHTFLYQWERKKESYSITVPQGMNAVQIMSIHKSKGLEFPIVIFPFANSYIYKEKDPKLWLQVNAADYNGFSEVLISKKKELLDYENHAPEIYGNEQEKMELDAFNVLYVVLTRAEKELYIISEKDLSKGNEKLDYYSGLFISFLKQKGIWTDNNLTYSFGEQIKGQSPSNEESNTINVPYLYTNIESATFKLLTNSGSLWGSNQEEALEKGNLLHHILAEIYTADDVDNVFENLWMNGELNPHEIAPVKNVILQIVNHPQLSAYYSNEYTIKNEQDIISQNGEILRPDRIVLKDKHAIVIDYKTGVANTKYHEQINRYASALESMQYSIDQKIIIYINKELKIKYI